MLSQHQLPAPIAFFIIFIVAGGATLFILHAIAQVNFTSIAQSSDGSVGL